MRSTKTAPPVEVIGLRSAFGEHLIHDDLNLSVKRGEVLGVVGGSGAGKSVLLNTIIGLKTPEGGQVKVFGIDIAHATHRQWQAIERRVGRALPSRGALDQPDGQGERRRAAARAHPPAPPGNRRAWPT